MKKKYRKRLVGFVIVIAVFMSIIVFTAWKFNKELANVGMEAARQELRGVAASNGQNIQKEYSQMVNSLKVLAENVVNDRIESLGKANDFMQFLVELNGFDYVGISDEEGKALDSGGRKVNIGDREYFSEAMKGNITISDVIPSKIVDEQDIQVIAVPMMNKGNAIGMVYGILNLKTVHDTLENTTENSIYTQIIDSKGKPVTRLQRDSWILGYDNIWEYYDHSEFMSGSSEIIQKDMEKGRSGYYILSCQDEKRITYYAPLGISGYYIFSNLETTPLRELMDKINGNARKMAGGIAVAFFILIFSLYYLNKKVAAELRESYEAKISSEEILRIAANHSNAFVFEYDLEKHIFKRKTEKENILFPQEIIEGLPETIVKRGILEKDSVKSFIDAFEKISVNETASASVQVISDGQTKWYRILMKNIYDEKRRIINTVGAVSDITEIKKQEERIQKEKRGKEQFRQKAERDGLTGLYNGGTAAEKIDEILGSEKHRNENHILIFIDLDNFKKINDTFGHHYGNQVLVEMAVILAKKFRHDDIVARIGGDEFAVFLLNTASYEKVEHIFGELVEACDKVYEKDGKKVSVSASVGIALAPEHGCTYEELSRKADQALYRVKRNNKKGYCLYQNEK